MTRLIPYILYLMLLGAHHVLLIDPTRIGNAWIDLAALMVIAVAIYKTEDIAVWFAFFAGLVAFAAGPEKIGFHALALVAVAIITVQLRERLNLASMWSKLYLMLGGVFVHAVLVVLIARPGRFSHEIWSEVPLVAVYTTAIAWVFFLFKEGHLTWTRIKSIF